MKQYNGNLFHDITIRIVKLINIIFMTVPFTVAWYTFYKDLLWVKFSMRGHWLVIALFVLLYFMIGRTYEAFKMSYTGRRQIVYSQMLSLLEVDVIMYIVAWLLIRHMPNVLPFIGIIAAQFVLSCIWAYFAQAWYFHTFPANKTVIIYDMRKGISQLIDEYKLGKKFKVIKGVYIDDCLKDLSMLDDADTVFMVGVHSHDRNIVAKYCLMKNITAYMIPRVGDLIIMGAEKQNLFHLLLLRITRFDPPMEYLVIKRIMDFVLSLIALIVLSPVFLVTALAIKKEDGGPVFYKQVRLTKNGKEFEILKFRSMRTDAEKDGVARLSTGDDDDRITKVGRIIRKCRLDELPQLINILKGEMSIVGPRAERPEIAKEYEEELPEFALRLQTKAGLTGYAQIYGKYNTTPYDKLLMDMMYISNPSLFEDIKLIFATVKILFMAESTEGVAEGQENAMVSAHIGH